MDDEVFMSRNGLRSFSLVLIFLTVPAFADSVSILKRQDGTVVSPVPKNIELLPGDQLLNNQTEKIQVIVNGTELSVEPSSNLSITTGASGAKSDFFVHLEAGQVTTTEIKPPADGGATYVVVPGGQVQVNTTPGQVSSVTVRPQDKTSILRVFNGSSQISMADGQSAPLGSGQQVAIRMGGADRGPASTVPAVAISTGTSAPPLVPPPPPMIGARDLGNKQVRFEPPAQVPPIQSTTSPLPPPQVPTLPPVNGRSSISATVSVE